jgi:uncharacterized membrane protein HdeD (DUF308 family)
VQLFALGIVRVVAAFAIPDTSATAKMLSVVLGALSFIVGVVCLRSPLQTVVVLTLVLGAFWLIHGVADIADGVNGRGQPGRVWTIVSGVTALIGGIVVLSSPEASAVTLAWFLGILLLLQGIIAIVAAVGRTRSLETAPTSPATPMASTGSMQATPDAARHAAG